MPYAACPACKTDVKYPRDAAPGTRVTCRECDEVFVPPKLRENPARPGRKAYDPREEETYEAERPVADPDAERKTRRAVAVARAGRASERSRTRSRKKSWHEGPELWFLICALGAGGGLPFGFWLANNWEQMGGAKFFWLMVAMVFIAVVATSLGMGSWAWLRKNGY
jgi:hypothetical protein